MNDEDGPMEEEWDGVNQGPVRQNYLEAKLLGESHLSVVNFIRDLFYKNEFQSANREKTFENKLFLTGNSKGDVKGMIYVRCSHFVKQLVVGVNTEDGVQKAANVIFSAYKDPGAFHQVKQEILKLTELHASLESHKFTLLGKVPEKDLNLNIKKKEEVGLKATISSILTILRKTDRESSVCFDYGSPDEQTDAQIKMVDLGIHFIKYCKENSGNNKQLEYECLMAMLKRGEFNLEYLCLSKFSDRIKDEKSKKTGSNTHTSNGESRSGDKRKSKKLKKLLEKKKKVALDYQELLYRACNLAFSLLTQKGKDAYERKFIQYCLALCYIRIPSFRETMNVALNVKDNMLSEIEGTMYDDLSYQKKKYSSRNAALYGFFDWDNEFYEHIQDEPRYAENTKILDQLMQSNEWKERFNQRSTGFFFFVKEYSKYLGETIVSRDNIPWHDIPGYKVMLKAFLVEMKNREVKEYPEPLIMASKELLINLDI